ncbi:MAG: HEAT repeat domain-containing protein [bacterium]|nr:HEAT repeat domain-containing protein [bacterium]
MRKKILIIGICLMVVVMLVIGAGIFIIKKAGYGIIPVVGTGIPTYVANKVLPPPNITKKSNEEIKEILANLFIEEAQAGYSYQIMKACELCIKIMRLGTPIVPVLIDLFQDKTIGGKEKVLCGAYKIECNWLIRNGAIELLQEIIKAKAIPLEEQLKKVEEPFKQNLTKRFYKYANRIEVDIDKIILELIEILEDALPDKSDFTIEKIANFFKEIKDKRGIEILIKAFKSRQNEDVRRRVIERNRKGRILDDIDRAKMRIEEALIAILKKTKDRRIAEVLDKDGANYGVWVWVDEAGRDKAIRIAMDVLRGSKVLYFSPDKEKEAREFVKSHGKWFGISEEQEIEKRRKKYAIGILGTAKAKEAVPLLIELLEKDIYLRSEIITVLGEIGTKEAVDALIYLLIHLKENHYRGGGY